MSTTTAKPLKMSDTALKFGPEWLRALSHGDTAVSPPPSPSLGAPRYKLAQHRYGREEMLALYDKMMKAPDDLTTAPPIYIEKTQTPLALIQMSDEEMRMWQRGVNSDVVLKQMGRTAGPPVGGSGPPVGAGASRGRGGGSMDRGRGRARGVGSAVGAYNRGTSYEDGGDPGDHGTRREGPPTGYGRGTTRPFERSQSSSERVWIERPERNGGGAESETWNGSTSPRKEFGTARPAAGDNNWRSREAMRERAERAENKEEEDGWRTAGRGERWGRTGWRSEREGGERDPPGGEKRDPWVEGSNNSSGGGGGVGGGGGGTGERSERVHRTWDDDGRPTGSAGYYSNSSRGGRGGHHPNRRGWDENDSLPEWVAEEHLQGGGTFDSSGAFRDERWSDEDDGEGKKRRVLRKRAEPSHDGGVGDEDGGPVTVDSPSKDNVKDSQIHEEQPAASPPAAVTPVQVAAHQISATSAAATVVNSSPPALRGPSPESSSMLSQPNLRVDEDGLEHAQAVVSTLVAQLVEDEDQPKPSPSPPNPQLNLSMDQWFYRDPQGEVQGPFATAEMSEWFNSGYFTMALSVRRACDERYAQLGELTKMWGRLPFMPGPPIPPMKNSDLHPLVSAEQEKLQMLQQQLIQQQMFQQQMMQQQHMLRQQTIIAKLSQMEGWNTLSPIQQQQVVNQHMANMPHPLPGDPVLQQLRLQMEAQAKLQAEMIQLQRSKEQHQQQQQQQQQSVHSLVNHLSQHQQQPQAVLEQPALANNPNNLMKSHDPIQAFIQQLLGQSKSPPAVVSKPPTSSIMNNPKPQEAQVVLDPIQSLIQQAQWNANHVAAQSVGGTIVDPVMGNHVAPGFHGLPPGVGVPWHNHSALFQAGPAELHPPMTSVWDLESAKVEEAKRQMEQQHQQQMAAEMHRREMEEKRMKEEEEERRRRLEIQEREEERMRIEEMRRETERQQQAEEMRRRELAQQQQQQQQQMQAMEEKRRREEEKRKREEELKQQQLEEERIRREEERIRKEEEKAAEQHRRQQEALQRLQEQQAVAQAQARAAAQQAAAAAAAAAQQQAQAQAQAKAAQAMMAPWAQQQQQQPQQQQQTGESLSMAEIQKLQEEKEAKERAIAQAQKAEQAARAAALLQQQQQQAAIKLRWAKQNTPTPSNAKSLAEIQAEEAAQLAQQKEKEAKEKANQQVNMAHLNLAAASAWGSSHHSNSAWSSGRTVAAVVAQQQPPPPPPSAAAATAATTTAKTNHSTTTNADWKIGLTVGFWEDPTPPPPKATSKPAQQQAAAKSAGGGGGKSAAAAAAKQPQQQAAGAKQQQQPATSKTSGSTTTAAASNNKNRSNKEEEAVRKLFNQTAAAAAEKKDSFSQWCFEYLKKVQAQIDVPTFVAFLKDVESPFEVQEYVRLYLGEGKDAKEFAKQFLDQRSRWRQMQRNVQQYEEDNMCIPAKAINPGQSSDFHEVKSKSKKSKKKMQKVDASLLGFSVSASTDRINVGERDFVDGM